MISCGPLDTSCDPSEDNTGAVAFFVPGHLPGAEVKFHRRLRPQASTYIAYDRALDGGEAKALMEYCV